MVNVYTFTFFKQNLTLTLLEQNVFEIFDLKFLRTLISCKVKSRAL